MKLQFWLGIFLIFLGGLIMGISLALMTVKPAHAYEFAENWTWTDTALETTYVALTVVDWGQTRNIVNSGGKYSEINPILGKHPSMGEVDTLTPSAVIAHALIAMALPPRYRRYWQFFFIGAEGIVVLNNYKIGLHIDF